MAIGHDVVAGDARPAPVRRGERAEDPHGRRLARAVGPEEREDAAARHAQVDAVQHPHVAVGLHEAGRLDRGLVGHLWCAPHRRRGSESVTAYAVRTIA